MMLAWWGTWLSLTFVFISSLILGLWLGPWWAWALGLAALLAMAGWQMWFVSRLLKWLKGPMDARVPRAWGVWDLVFAGLHRRVRVRMEQQQMLQEALERLRRAGEALPDGVITFNRFRQIDGINARAALHFGLNPMVDKGQPLTNLIRQPEFVAYLEAGYYDEPLTLHNDRVPGQTLQVQLVPYGEGQTLLLSRDISQLEKLETMRRDFVANVSHELKTPLTVVNGFVEMLVDDYGAHSPEEAVHYLRLVQDQATRMQHLIEDLLTLSALETGARRLRKSGWRWPPCWRLFWRKPRPSLGAATKSPWIATDPPYCWAMGRNYAAPSVIWPSTPCATPRRGAVWKSAGRAIVTGAGCTASRTRASALRPSICPG